MEQDARAPDSDAQRHVSIVRAAELYSRPYLTARRSDTFRHHVETPAPWDDSIRRRSRIPQGQTAKSKRA